jgi:chromosome partitioning protein
VKVITILSEKGGTGKTTIATHLAAGLAIKGARAVLVDSDPQANATSAVGMEKSPAFYDLTVRNAPWKDVLKSVHPDVYAEPQRAPAGILFLVPGNVESRNIATTISNNNVIRRRFNELRSAADYLVVDTSPTPSLLHAAITLASDFIVVPTDCEAFSALEGLPDSIRHTGDIRSAAAEHNIAAAQLLAIIPTKYRSSTISHNEVLNYLRDEYDGLVWEPLSMSIMYAEAQLMRQFLFGFAPTSKATAEIWQLINRIIVETTKVQHEQAR